MKPGLDRRGLLAAAGAGALAGLATGFGSVRSAGLRRRAIRKAVKLEMVEVEGALLERFRLLAELGFDGVELPSPNAFDPEEVLAARDASGLVIHGVVDAVHWKHPLSHPEPEERAVGLEGLRTALRDCARYGGTTVLLVPAVVDARVGYDQAYERSQAEIRKALPLAEELGVSIAIENVWNSFLLSPLEAARYVDELGSERVGWYLDVGNVVTYGWPEQWVRILGERLKKLDVKEYSRAKRDEAGPWKGFDVEIGEGDCGWPAVMAALDEIGYEGWATAEVPGGDAGRLRAIAERMDRVLAS